MTCLDLFAQNPETTAIMVAVLAACLLSFAEGVAP
jgi:uncharacterized protein (DUF3084 family)